MQLTETRPRETEIPFEVAYENLPVGVAHIGCDGQILRVNARLRALGSRLHSELVGERIEHLLLGDDLQAASRHAVRLLRGDVHRASFEMHLVQPSGGGLRTKVSLGLQRDASGHPDYFIAVVDVLDARDHDDPTLLRRQEGRLRRALDAANLDVFEYEVATGRVNRQGPLGRLLGLPPGYSGTDFFSLIHPQDRAGFFAALESLSPSHSAYTFEYRVRTPAGAWLWLFDQARGQFDERGRVVRVTGVFADITSRKEAEQALAQEQELLRRTLDSIPVMLCLLDPRQQRATLNRHFEAVLGWSTADANEDGFLERLYPDDASQRDQSLEAILSLGANCRVTEVTARDGTRIPCEWIHARLSDDTKIIIGWDLRQHRANEARLARHAERQALLLDLSSSLLQVGQNGASRFPSVFGRIQAHLGADIRFEHQVGTPAGVLHLMAGFGIPVQLRKAVQQHPTGSSSCAMGEATATDSLVLGEPFIARREDAAFLSARGVQAYVGYPLHDRDRQMLGTFVLASTRRAAFTSDEADCFRMLCQLVTLAARRILSDRELRKRTQQYRLALEASQLGSWRREVLDSDIYHLDARAQAHYGVDEVDLPQAGLLERVHPEDRHRVEQHIVSARSRRAGHDGESIEHRVIHPDGSERWLSVHAKLVFEQREGASVLVRYGITADITERKRIEQALQEVMADLRRAQTVARVGSWRFDVRRKLRFWSEEAYRIFGVPVGRPLDYDRFLACVHPEDRQRVAEQWKAAAAGKGAYDIEHRIMVGSQIKWVHQKAELEFDNQGELTSGFATVQDITALKKADAALRESEARFRTLADSMPQVVWQANPEGEIVYRNQHSQSHIDYWQDAEGHWQWLDVVHPDDRQRTSEAWQQALRCGTPYEVEHRVRHVDGCCRWYLSRAVPIRDARGRITHWYGTSTEVDALKQAEAAVQETAVRMRAIVDTVMDGILTVDEQGLIESANPAIERLFGHGSAELRGAPISLLIPGLRWEEQAGLAAGGSGENAGTSDQARLLKGSRKNGTLFPVELSVSETPLPDRRIYTALVHDVTVHKEQEDMLRRLADSLVEVDRCKDEFVATLAHELRNPLGALRNAAMVLRFKGDEVAPRTWGIDAIDRQVAHLARLIEDLLDANRVSRNMLELRCEEVTLQEIVDAALEGSLPLIQQQQHQLHVQLPSHDVALEADPVRLIQVFQNLLDNASKYTPPGGRIELLAHLEGAEVVILVRDSGIGISQEAQKRLFDMFYQVDRGSSQGRNGLGIGLTLVQRLVQMHGGVISANSDGEGCGSTFIVRLPLTGQL